MKEQKTGIKILAWTVTIVIPLIVLMIANLILLSLMMEVIEVPNTSV